MESSSEGALDSYSDCHDADAAAAPEVASAAAAAAALPDQPSSLAESIEFISASEFRPIENSPSDEATEGDGDDLAGKAENVEESGDAASSQVPSDSSSSLLNPFAQSFVPSLNVSVKEEEEEEEEGRKEGEAGKEREEEKGRESLSSTLAHSGDSLGIKDDFVISQTVEILEPVLREPSTHSQELDKEDLEDEEEEKEVELNSEDVDDNDDNETDSVEILSFPRDAKSNPESMSVTPGSESPVMVSPPLSDEGSRTPKMSQGSEADNSSGFEMISSGERSPAEEKPHSQFPVEASPIHPEVAIAVAKGSSLDDSKESDQKVIGEKSSSEKGEFEEAVAASTVIEVKPDEIKEMKKNEENENVKTKEEKEEEKGDERREEEKGGRDGGEMDKEEERKRPEGETEEETSGWEDILGSGTLMKKTVIEGEADGVQPTVGQFVKIMTEGKLEDGSQVDLNEALEFTIGDHDVIHAWDIVARMLRIGEVCEIKTDPKFAYGKLGRDDVPPDAKIHYVIALLDIKGPLDYGSMSPTERLDHGLKKKERGNALFKREEFSQAIVCYTKAVKILDADAGGGGDATGSPSELQRLLEEKLKVYNNLAATQTKLLAYDAAVRSCDTVLKLQPSNVKALFRKGKVLELQKDTAEALACYKKSLKLDPNSKVIKKDVERLSKLAKVQEDKEKRLYAKMLGTESPKPEEKPSRDNGSWRVGSWFGSWALAVAGTAALVGVTVLAVKNMS